MTSKAEIAARLEYHQSLLTKLREACLALAGGGVKSYTIDDRSLTNFDLPDLRKQIAEEEREVDRLTSMRAGRKPRAAFGVLPRNW